jgi:hypothetical protein
MEEKTIGELGADSFIPGPAGGVQVVTEEGSFGGDRGGFGAEKGDVGGVRLDGGAMLKLEEARLLRAGSRLGREGCGGKATGDEKKDGERSDGSPAIQEGHSLPM